MEYMKKENSDKLTREQQNLMLPPELQGKKFRIRKLTPRECFRLMGVDDKDIDKIQAGGSAIAASISSLATASLLTCFSIYSVNC